MKTIDNFIKENKITMIIMAKVGNMKFLRKQIKAIGKTKRHTVKIAPIPKSGLEPENLTQNIKKTKPPSYVQELTAPQP